MQAARPGGGKPTSTTERRTRVIYGRLRAWLEVRPNAASVAPRFAEGIAAKANIAVICRGAGEI